MAENVKWIKVVGKVFLMIKNGPGAIIKMGLFNNSKRKRDYFPVDTVKRLNLFYLSV